MSTECWNHLNLKILVEIIFVPLLAYDVSKNRLGYGKGFYDRYLFKYLKINKIEQISIMKPFSPNIFLLTSKARSGTKIISGITF